MTTLQLPRWVGAATGIGMLVLAGAICNSALVRADSDDNDGGDSRVKQGLMIAPVPLNLAHKNKALVGLGSYIVNAAGDCNGCHSRGPQTEFIVPGNPYLLSFDGHERINPATYLGGGRSFGLFPAPIPGAVEIISRNLTPDHTGLPIGGDTFLEFKHTIRTGLDPDHLHPILPAGFNGAVLQIMPWPIYRNMSDRDLRAIYEYLSAIPCVAGPGHVC